MSLRAKYDLNREIAEFVLGKTQFSQEDIAYINQYVGYGGMADLSDDFTPDQVLYEYYTPIEAVKKMVGLAYRYGYKGGPVLEPSCGIGRFLHYFSPTTKVVGIELDEVSHRIAQANFPTFEIKHQRFNNLFVDRRGNPLKWKPEFELVIGNPPYGKFSGRGTVAEKSATKAETYVDYFITRGLDVLLPGGLLIYIIPSAFLSNKENEGKRRILSKGELIDAYRLPVNIFDQTSIQTDIVVFKKK